MREEANGRTACGVGGGGGKSRRASPDNEVGRQHKPRRLKCLMGVGGGSTAGAWVTYRRARACAWSASSASSGSRISREMSFFGPRLR